MELEQLSGIKRICTICKDEKPIEYFEKAGKNSKGETRYKYQCKLCRNELKRNQNK